MTVTDNTEQRFILGLEEIVLPTKERNIKTVFIENGKGTFETKNTGIYRPLYYCRDVKKISEENITINVVKGYAEIEDSKFISILPCGTFVYKRYSYP